MSANLVDIGVQMKQKSFEVCNLEISAKNINWIAWREIYCRYLMEITYLQNDNYSINGNV